MGLGFLHFDSKNIVQFAKFSIDIDGFHIYVTEIYLLGLLVLLAANFRAVYEKFKKSFSEKNIIFILTLFFLIIGLFRAAFDFFGAPMLVLRNAAFIWYLSIPLCIYLLPIQVQTLNIYFRIILCVAFFYFTIFNVEFIFGERHVYWIPFVSVYAPLALLLVHESWLLAILFSIPIGFALGAGYWQGLQRTSLVGMFMVFVVLLVLQKKYIGRIFSRLAILISVFLISAFLLANKPGIVVHSFSTNPLKKSAANATGAEIFRTQMWLDALHLFLEHPLRGVGFREQVVYRVYQGYGFVPNDGKSSQEANGNPIAGPHNSYLNSLARLGVFGILLFVIHLLAFRRLWIAQAWPGLFLLYAQMLYAFFNVGLEGPVRSFFLLISLGMAMKINGRSDAS